jgi:hypothetical protein
MDITFRAVLEEQAAARRGATQLILTLCAAIKIDPTPYLSEDAPAVPSTPTMKRAPATKGTKRAERPTNGAPSETGARILEVLKKHGEPMRPRDVAATLGVEWFNLKDQVKKLIEQKQVTATGATTSRRLSLA